MTNQLHFGIQAPQQHISYQQLLEIWSEADREPLIDHMWLFDHFMPLGGNPDGPCFESWTMLAALAAKTERVRIGHMVTGNTYRHPAILARQAVTVDHISRGRLNFGIGAAWHEQEHQGYGLTFPSAAERVRRLDEACQVIQLLWTQTNPSFDGHYYQLQQAHSEPKPQQKPFPPLMIAAGGDQMLRVVARHANMWCSTSQTAEDFREKSARLTQHCETIGRDPSTIERLASFLISPADTTFRQARETAQNFIEAGATHIVLNIAAFYHQEGVIPRLLHEVIKPLKQSDAQKDE
ncbi:TIGR03560 family F420-dependent LLM class oxidoreductase [Dictyobacter kobayashii]|uniref:Monooxygenase n=1 Tax=Dictyobacter kobayashii TaxID=2014872 RepID=A0A402AP19_9CHLR|nr:TIGR03560 family F420-dependent LLM class oxidoreductase [Dictyobacter kobayashii]GCE20832.1 monooxygenase [Dictyobacter kobayashii]